MSVGIYTLLLLAAAVAAAANVKAEDDSPLSAEVAIDHDESHGTCVSAHLFDVGQLGPGLGIKGTPQNPQHPHTHE